MRRIVPQWIFFRWTILLFILLYLSFGAICPWRLIGCHRIRWLAQLSLGFMGSICPFWCSRWSCRRFYRRILFRNCLPLRIISSLLLSIAAMRNPITVRLLVRWDSLIYWQLFYTWSNQQPIPPKSAFRSPYQWSTTAVQQLSPHCSVMFVE